MLKRLKSIVLSALALTLVAAYALPPQSAFAEGSSSLSIVPKKNYIVEPGKSVKDKLTIHNIDRNSELELNLRVIDFSFTDDGGTPKLMLDPKAEQTTWSLKPFLTVPETVTIPPSSSKTLNMSVSIPAGHGAGSYYSAIIYSTGAPDGGNVGLSASGVTLVFVDIPGDVNEDLQLEKFGPYSHDGRQYHGYFVAADPRVMAYTLKNNGNVTEAPAGTITLKHMFGKEYKIDNVNPNKSLALIGQTRTFESCVKLEEKEVEIAGSSAATEGCASPGLWPGHYTATVELYYGQNGNPTKDIIKTIGFWYLPWWFIAVLMVVLAVAAFYIWKLVRKIRRALYGPQGKPRKKVSRR